MGLRLHTRLRNEIEDVGKDAQNARKLIESRNAKRQNGANARKTLNAVVEADDTIIALIGNDLALLLHIDASGRDGQAMTDKGFQAQTRPWAHFRRAIAASHAAFANQFLTTAIFLHLTIQSLVTKIHGTTARAKA